MRNNCNCNRNNGFNDISGFSEADFLDGASTFNDDSIYGFGYNDTPDGFSNNRGGRHNNRPIVTDRNVIATGNVFATGDVFRIRNNSSGCENDWRHQVFCQGYRTGYRNGFIAGRNSNDNDNDCRCRCRGRRNRNDCDDRLF